MREPVTRTINASEARNQWSSLLNMVYRKETRVLVEKSGIPVAAIISADDLERFTRFEMQRRERFKALEGSWAAFEGEDPDEIERQVARAIGEVRANRRNEEQGSAPEP